MKHDEVAMRNKNAKSDLTKRGRLVASSAKTNPNRSPVERLPGNNPEGLRTSVKRKPTTAPVKQAANRKSPSIRPNIGRMEGSNLDHLIDKAKSQVADIARKERYATAAHWDIGETLDRIRSLCTKKGDWERALHTIGLPRQRAWEYRQYPKIFASRNDAASCPVLEANRRIQEMSSGKNYKRPYDHAAKSDEYYTPPYALTILLPYLPQDKIIWEAAWGTGELAGHLTTAGYQVVGDPKMNCLTQEPSAWDVLLTNPPYGPKDPFLRRTYDLNKPFALLLPLDALGGKERVTLYRKHGIQLLIPDKRINFHNNRISANRSSSTFPTAWYCWKLNLPKDLNFVEASW